MLGVKPHTDKEMVDLAKYPHWYNDRRWTIPDFKQPGGGRLFFIHIPKTGGTAIEDAGERAGYSWGRFDRHYDGLEGDGHPNNGKSRARVRAACMQRAHGKLLNLNLFPFNCYSLYNASTATATAWQMAVASVLVDECHSQACQDGTAKVLGAGGACAAESLCPFRIKSVRTQRTPLPGLCCHLPRCAHAE